jgi:Reverse transcriptase (RNA-dependent DNA polymerase)
VSIFLLNLQQSFKPLTLAIIGSKWEFRKKKNGIYRACLCALGYNQVPGIDYIGNFATVVNDVTLWLVFLSRITNLAWNAQVYDVKTAFLHGELEEPVKSGQVYWKFGSKN